MRPIGTSQTLGRLDVLTSQPDTSRVRRGADPRAVASEFEAVMLQELVKSMRATTTLDGAEPKNDQMVEHLMDEAMAGHLARAGGIGLASYIVGPETAHSAESADDTLKFQGRVDVDSFERHLRFPEFDPSSEPVDQTAEHDGITPPSAAPLLAPHRIVGDDLR